ncbi:MAG: hypothetical protein BZY88_16015 [SAR202 cluster bacterium Io17-Chloro-G9]|nr:MAG: hypothetical protein BZY88_16015 [SAR202 cluster bacterium Io17-Chloro-G9]
MSAAESIQFALQRNWEMIDAALEGLDDATLSRSPADQCNSIAWILWHVDRVVDTFIHTRLRTMTQLWVRDGWHLKYCMSADTEDRGVGWTAEQVAGWQAPPREIQLGYYEAIKAATKEYLASLTAADLDVRMVIPPLPEPRSVGTALGQMTWEYVAHGGQIAYLRGLFIGMGWFR